MKNKSNISNNSNQNDMYGSIPFYHFYYAPIVLKKDIGYKLYKKSDEAVAIFIEYIRKSYPDFLRIDMPDDVKQTYAKQYKKLDMKSVYLLALCGEIYISDNVDALYRILSAPYSTAFSPIREDGDIHLFEFESFEEAYKCALGMREPNPLCYEKD